MDFPFDVFHEIINNRKEDQSSERGEIEDSQVDFVGEHDVHQNEAQVEQQEKAGQLENVVEIYQNDVPDFQSELDHVQNRERHFALRVSGTGEGNHAKRNVSRNRNRPDEVGFFGKCGTLQVGEFEAQEPPILKMVHTRTERVNWEIVPGGRFQREGSSSQRGETYRIKMRQMILNKK